MFGSGGDGYGGLIGAFPYAFRTSKSRLFRGYVVVGGLVAILATVLFASSVVTLLADTFRTSGGTFTFSRSFVVVIALGIVGPILAPVLLVARRHRRTGSTVRYDRALATAGFGFLLSIYLALVISAPSAVRDEPPALIAPLVRVLYDLPQIAGLVPLLLGALLISLAHRAYR